MNTVEIRLIGTREECQTIITLLSHVAGPVEIKANKPADNSRPRSTRRIYAEIHTRFRDRETA